MKEIVRDVDTFLLPNTKLTVSLGSEEFAKHYDSRIEDLDAGSILIAVPSEKGVPVPLHRGLRLSVSCFTDHGRLKFDSRVVELVKGRLPMIRIERPTQMEREQLRNFFRVDTRLNITLFLVSLNDFMKAETPALVPNMEAVLQDISGGGCKISTTRPLDAKMHVTLDFTKSEAPELGFVDGNVVRTTLIAGKTVSSVTFAFEREKEQDKVIRYVFQRQIELRNMLGKN